MTETRLPAAWLRPLLGLFAIAGVLALSACGGGSGAPNNPYAPGPAAPGPLTVLPPTAVVYSGVPATLAVTGGTGPYFAFSSNSAVLPVTQAVAGANVLLLGSNVATDTDVEITVQDTTGATAKSTVTVRAAPLLPNLITVTPNGTARSGRASARAAPGSRRWSSRPRRRRHPQRPVRFDVVFGAYAIQNSATPRRRWLPT
jgi:hypothetical protein